MSFTGDGSVATPFTPELIIPSGAVVPHPFLPGVLPDTINGPVCDPTGLLAPQPGFPSYASDGLPFGSNPDIVANTAGQIPWGPVLTVPLINPNTDRYTYWFISIQFPYVTATLEAGAAVRVGVIIDPLGLAIYGPQWQMTNNSGAAVETYGMYLENAGSIRALAPSVTDNVETQMWVEATGFTGASSIVTFGGDGVEVDAIGVPV